MAQPTGKEPESLQPRLMRAFEFAARQVRATIARDPDFFPMYTKNGRWKHDGENWTDWCAGFHTGMMWLIAQRTDDPWWREDPHRAAYVQQGVLGPTVSTFWTFNPAYAQVQNEHVWPTGWADITTGGMTPQAAAEKAFKRVEEIFAKYPIAQG